MTILLLLCVGIILNLLVFTWRRWLACHWFGFCPACNSDAPERDTCEVCSGYAWPPRKMPSKDRRKLWWLRYLRKKDKP